MKLKKYMIVWMIGMSFLKLWSICWAANQADRLKKEKSHLVVASKKKVMFSHPRQIKASIPTSPFLPKKPALMNPVLTMLPNFEPELEQANVITVHREPVNSDIAPQLEKILPNIKVNGKIRLYDFSRQYGNPDRQNQSSFSLGGSVNLLSDPFWHGFQVGGTYYTAQPLGLNSSLHKQDPTLPGTPLSALGQAFIQYRNAYWLARVGDQLVRSPWITLADTRMIPATYQGFFLTTTPFANYDLNFSCMRLVRFKSRTASTFTKTNLYNPVNLGSTPIKALQDYTNIGSLALGAHYKKNNFHALAWYYKFYDFSHLTYGEIRYGISINDYLQPLLGVQIAYSQPDGKDVVNRIGLGKTRSSVYGVLIGSQLANGQLSFGYNHIPKRKGGYRNGDVVSPYTSGYAADPLYSSSMDAGLVEKAAGYAGKITGSYAFLEHQLLIKVSYAKYYTAPFIPNTNETDFDITYMPVPVFKKNLSIRGRVGILNGVPENGRFVYARLMIEYDFA